MQIPFQSSERASLGVEWELQLVDRDTRELSPGAVDILEELRPDGEEEHPKATHELLQSTIEIITGVLLVGASYLRQRAVAAAGHAA